MVKTLIAFIHFQSRQAIFQCSMEMELEKSGF